MGQYTSAFTKAYRAFARGILARPEPDVTLPISWSKERIIPESAFPDGALEKLRKQLEDGGRVAVRLPLTLKLKTTGQTFSTSFDVFIESPPDLDRNEEAFVRRDLLIGSESHVTAGSFVQKTRSMTLIQDRDLSDFLLSAEEPTHLKWNASLARDKGQYARTEEVLRSIRQAVPRLLAVLLNGGMRRDVKSLARYFSRPAAEPTKKSGDEGRNKQRPAVPPVTDLPPPPVAKPFRLESDGAAIKVVPNGVRGPTNEELPIRASLELAYEGLDQDPFAAYDPYDFDVSQATAHPVAIKGVAVLARSANRVDLEITDSDFSFEIRGFDPNMRMRARLNYETSTLTDSESAGEA